MAFRVGGLEGINKAIECKNTATCEYSSGLQVSGVFTEVHHRCEKTADLFAHDRPSALAYEERNCRARPRLSQGRLRLADRRTGSENARSARTDQEARELEFESGVVVEGKVEKILRRDGKLLLITFSNCTREATAIAFLFDPAWGAYDMAVGERISFGLQRRRR